MGGHILHVSLPAVPTPKRREEQRYTRRTAHIFNERHPDENVGHQYVLDLVHKLQENGSVCNEIVKNRRVLTEAAQVEILDHFVMDSQTSIPKVFRIQLLQQLAEDDYDRRI